MYCMCLHMLCNCVLVSVHDCKPYIHCCILFMHGVVFVCLFRLECVLDVCVCLCIWEGGWGLSERVSAQLCLALL